MGGKAKPKKHTAAELQAKADAHKPRGGGAAGMAERQVTIKFQCEICKAQMCAARSCSAGRVQSWSWCARATSRAHAAHVSSQAFAHQPTRALRE